jgi:hypothetical protein
MSCPSRFDAADVKLLALVHVDFEEGQFLFVVKGGGRKRLSSWRSRIRVSLLHDLQSVGDLLAAEDLSVIDGKRALSLLTSVSVLLCGNVIPPRGVARAFVHMNKKGNMHISSVRCQRPREPR